MEVRKSGGINEWTMNVVTDVTKTDKRGKASHPRSYGQISLAYTLSALSQKLVSLNDPNGFSYFDGKWILFH